MSLINRFIDRVSPFQLLVAGYLFITLLTAFILTLPISTADGKGQNFIDALFIASSGISTTGLSMVDLGTFYSLFGQIVIMVEFQIGGIGYMTIIIFLSYLFGVKTMLSINITAKESMAGANPRALGKFFIVTLVITLIFELIGAAALTISWWNDFTAPRAIYYGIFHSISAFCTAGFSLFPDSLIKYKDSVSVNAAINIISLLGAIGFFVLYDIYAYIFKWRMGIRSAKLSLHTKLILTVTGIILFTGTFLIFLSEQWCPALTYAQRLNYSLFQAISASTTDGFNTIDIAAMGPAGLTVIMILMFIGASPGSTGGGIKTSTLGIIAVFLKAQLKDRDDSADVFSREIPMNTISKAFGVFFWFIIIIVIDLLILLITERAGYLQLLFEIVSALGNAGLSTGITTNLSSTAKIILSVTMFIGRVGPLTMGFFIVGNQRPPGYRYAEEDVYVG